MAAMPLDPESFGDAVLSIFRRLFPDRQVELSGPMDMLVGGRHLGLENVFRMVQADPERATELVEAYFERLIEGDAIGSAPMPLAMARGRIMPRIQPESIFRHLDREQVAHSPFVNGTVVVYVIDLPSMTVSITTEQVIRWGLDSEQLEKLARRNLARSTPELPVQLVSSAEGGKAAIVSRQDGYDAARLLLGTLHRHLAPRLGGDFFVATPSRDMFVAFTCEPKPFVERVRTRVAQDYRRLPYPITEALFLVTMDGVAGTAEAA